VAIAFKNKKTAIAFSKTTRPRSQRKHTLQKQRSHFQKQQDSNRPFSIINNNKTAIALG
jgi:hypothetical protein